jgi:Zn-dependent alcohol dehydrogenase
MQRSVRSTRALSYTLLIALALSTGPAAAFCGLQSCPRPAGTGEVPWLEAGLRTRWVAYDIAGNDGSYVVTALRLFFNRSGLAVGAEVPFTRSDMEVAALFGCAVTTGFGVVVNNAKVKIGESVVVFGAGGVGLNIVQAAAMVSAYPLIAVDLHDNRLELAKQMGATHLINSTKTDARQAILDIVGAAGVDVFIDNTGQPVIIEMGYQLAKPQGRVTLVGVPRKGNNINVYSLPLHFGKGLSGSHGGEAIPEQDIPRYQELYRSGRLMLRELLTEQYMLSDINAAIAAMRSGQLAGRCLIRLID